MKQELLGLINQTDSIRRLAHSQNDYIPLDFVLYDVDEFIKWKQKIKSELIAIPNKDQYIGPMSILWTQKVERLCGFF